MPGTRSLALSKVAACTSEACDFKLWTTIAKKKLTATQLKEIIQNGRTSQPVKGLKVRRVRLKQRSF
ncbi:hypothetical protein LOS20_14360 [Enterococcus faecium]|nr:hypothetical protein [Enterococcus faecium]